MNSYVIIPIEELTDSMIENSLNDVNTIRYSLNGSKVILKFNSPFPDIMQGYIKYNNEQILQIINNSEWNPEI